MAFNQATPAVIASIPADPNGIRGIVITAMVVGVAGTFNTVTYPAGSYPYNPDGWVHLAPGVALTVVTATGIMTWCYG